MAGKRRRQTEREMLSSITCSRLSAGRRPSRTTAENCFLPKHHHHLHAFERLNFDVFGPQTVDVILVSTCAKREDQRGEG